MKNLIPQFIAEKYKTGKGSGTIKGSVMSLDLKGFTKMTGELMKNGKYGAEILSDIINGVFGPVIRSIYDNGGFITDFVGDAITAVFSERSAENAEICASDITGHFRKNKNVSVEKKKYPISVRIGISYGDIDWTIISTPERSAYFFKGDTVYKAADAQQAAEPGNYLKDASYKFPSGKKKISSPPHKKIRSDILKRFVPDRVLEMSAAGEFREIISAYISFDEKKTDIGDLSKALCTESVKYKGFLNKIDFGDKGGIALILFGAPLKEEKYPEYAVTFATDLVKRFPGIKIGLAKGTAFCGFVGSDLRSEYTAMGEVVNLSARLLGVTPAGEVRTDEWTSEYKYRNFSFGDKGSHLFKGFPSELKVFSPTGSKEKKTKPALKTVFVGRDKEIQKLKKQINPVLKSKFAGYVQINGNPGIGKTLLADKALEELPGVEKFMISCDNVTVKSLHPVTSFLSEHFGFNDGISEAEKIKDLKKHFRSSENPDKSLYFIGNALGIKIKDDVFDGLEGSDRYDNTILEIRNYINSLCRNKPAVIIIDDVHKADDGTLDLLRALARSENDVPLCLIATARYKDDGSKFTAGIDDIKPVVIDLDTLTKESAGAIAEHLLGGNLSPELFETVWDKSGGNPFYTEQLTLYLKDSGHLELKKSVYTIKKAEYGIPESISSVIISRIDRLSLELRHSLRTASVLGKEFSVKILSGMLKNRNVITHIRQIEKEAFWLNLSEMMYIFKHALIRDSVYQMQLKKTLKALHKLAAETISGIYKKDIERHYADLAYHYEKAEDRKNTRTYLLKAAKNAFGKYHLKEALGYDIKLLSYLKKDRDISEIKYIIGDLYYYLGDWKQSEKYYTESIELAEKTRDPALIIRAKMSYSELLSQKGDVDKAMNMMKELNKDAAKHKFYKQQSDILVNLGVMSRMKSNYTEALKYYDKVNELNKTIKDDIVQCSVYDNIGVVHLNTGDYDKALSYFDRSKKLAKRTNNIKGLMFSQSNEAMIRYQQGDLDTALKLYSDCMSRAEKIGMIKHKSVVLGHLAAISFYQAEYKKAYDYSIESYKISQDLGDRSGLCYICPTIGILSRKLGDNKTAFEYFYRHKALAEELKNKDQISAAHANLAFMYSLTGEFDKSNKFYERSNKIRIKLNDLSGIGHNYIDMGENYRNLGKHDKAVELYNKGIANAEKLDQKYILLSAYFFIGEVYLDVNDVKNARENYKKSFDLAVKLKRNDYRFDAELMLAFTEPGKTAVQKEKNILALDDGKLSENKQAFLNRTLYLLTKKDKYRKKARPVFEGLYKKFGYFEYRKALEEMGYTV